MHNVEIPQEDFAPHQFFDESLPEILGHFEESQSVPEGKMVIRLFGDEDRSWTVDLKNKQVTSGIADEQEFLLEMDDADFRSMMLGKLDFSAAIHDGRVRHHGNLQLLGHLGAIVQEWVK